MLLRWLRQWRANWRTAVQTNVWLIWLKIPLIGGGGSFGQRSPGHPVAVPSGAEPNPTNHQKGHHSNKNSEAVQF